MTPGMVASLGRSRPITSSAVMRRTRTSLSVMKQLPVLAVLRPPPVNAITFSTAGSSLTTLARRATRPAIACDEVDWSARIEPVSRPVSCCGKKPLGTRPYRFMVTAMVASVTASMIQWWSSAQVSERR